MFNAFVTPPKKTIVAIAAAASLTLLAGCGSNDATDAPAPTESASSAPASTPSQPSGNEPDSAPPRSAVDTNKALSDAGDLALKQIPDSTLISIESEKNDTEWEVQVVTSDGVEHEMNISADGTKVIDKPRVKDEDADDKKKHQDRVRAAKLDFKQAVKKIEDEVSGGKVTELNLDGEGAKTVWEADVLVDSTKRSVQIDASNGDVVKNKVDS